MPKIKPAAEFVVVEAAGQDDERVVHRCATFLEALRFSMRYGRTVNDVRAAGVDVMRVNPDGSFTTEI